jgi:hypothetical protein
MASYSDAVHGGSGGAVDPLLEANVIGDKAGSGSSGRLRRTNGSDLCCSAPGGRAIESNQGGA